jgi:predicted nucleic acid-binding protein
LAAETFVLDCSVALSWCFLDEQDAYATDVLRSLAKAQAVVPAIWPLEVTNGLLMGERRDRSTEADTARWLGSLALLPIEVDTRRAPEVFSAVAPLARAHGLTSYDGSYLELAVRRSVPFATMEPRLQQVAKKLGVALFRPKVDRRRRK